MRGNPWKSRDLINILVSRFDSESILNSKPILELMNRKGDTNIKCCPHQKQKIFLIVSNRVTTIKVKNQGDCWPGVLRNWMQTGQLMQFKLKVGQYQRTLRRLMRSLPLTIKHCIHLNPQKTQTQNRVPEWTLYSFHSALF